MGVVVSFQDFTPVVRYDAIPWTQIEVWETDDPDTGTWTQIDTIAISPVDPDPTAPASQSFTTENGTAVNMWYRIVFVDATGDRTEPTAAIHNIPSAVVAYASIDELARILKLRTPTAAQTAAMRRVLLAAAGEINMEIDFADDDALEGWERDLCEQVNLDRAADLWRHTESVPGIVGIPDEAMPVTFGRYSWERYAQRLSPVKRQWGLA